MKQITIKCPPEFDINSKVYLIPTASIGNKEITVYRILDFHYSSIGCGCNLAILKKQKGLEPFIRITFQDFYKIAFPTVDDALIFLLKKDIL